MLRTTLLEEKQFLGKILVIEFNVSNISFKIHGNEIKTNKWIQTFEWEQIYEKLDDILNKSKEVNLMDLDMSSFRIDNYIEVYLKKGSVHGKPFATMLGRKDNDITPVYLKIYIKRLSSCKDELPQIREIQIRSTPPSSQASSQSLEYEPTINGNSGSTLSYTPSNISNSEEAYTPSKMKVEVASSDSYVPKPISPPKRDYISSPEISAGTLPPKYKASKIRGRSQSPKTPAKKKQISSRDHERKERPKRPSNRKDNQKRSSRSDDEGEDLNSNKKKKENVTVRKLNLQPEIQSNKKLDDGWKSSRSVDKERREREPSSCSSTSSSSSKKKSKHDHHKDKRHEGSSKKDIRHFMSPIAEKSKKADNNELKVSEVPFPFSKTEEIENAKKKMEELQKVNAIINQINIHAENVKKRTPKPPRDGFLTLEIRDVDDFLETFDEYKYILDPIVEEFKAKYPAIKLEGVDGLMNLRTEGLVSEKCTLKILDFLTDKYERAAKCETNLSDLFITRIIPEWKLNLFIKKYKMNREEAIQQLNYQEEPIEEDMLKESRRF